MAPEWCRSEGDLSTPSGSTGPDLTKTLTVRPALQGDNKIESATEKRRKDKLLPEKQTGNRRERTAQNVGETML